MTSPGTAREIKIGRPECLLVWIRDELRLRDHQALLSASREANRIVPFFIISGEAEKTAPAKRSVILDGLTDLRADFRRLGGELFVRYGEPEEIIPAMISETGAGGVYCTRSYDPLSAARDRRIASLVTGSGKVWVEFDDRTLIRPGEILTRAEAKPYTVFTPYRNAWRARMEEIMPPLPAPRRVSVPRLHAGKLPVNREIRQNLQPPRGGAHTAETDCRKFLRKGLLSYGERRDVLAGNGTSRLSHHLAAGTLGIRTLFSRLRETVREFDAKGRESADVFLDELIWREFYYQILAAFPRVASGAFRQEFDAIQWSDDEERFRLWCDGMTGYPVVDAAMRQMNSEGWMHNRGRMIVASFLTKDLHIDWRKGERYFMSRLADGDPALNNGGWQWCAGTGNDASPWFRIFNPVLQGKKFDPGGMYVRQYLPELRRVPDRWIHEPWKMSPEVQRQAACLIGADYPAPVVLHDEERRKAFRYYSLSDSGRVVK